jgi:hypothetical protein
MHRQLRSGFAGLACALLVFGTASCKKAQEPAETTSTGTTATVPAPQASAPVAVSSVNLGRAVGADKRVTGETTRFGRNDTIYASVSTSGTGNGTLTARWTYQDGQVVDESTQPISATGPAVTEFHVSKPSGWPAGNYRVEVSLNGSPGQAKDFSVQ